MAISVETLAVIAFRIVSCVIIVIALCKMFKRHREREIPGPWTVPLLGSLPFLGLRLHLTLTNMQKQYGDVYQIKIGSQRVIVLCGLQTLKSALVDQAAVFAGRPKLYTFGLASEGKSMSFNSHGKQWKSHRRMAEQALKLASNMKPLVMEEVMLREAKALVQVFLKRSKGGTQGIDPEQAILWSVAHVKYTLCFGNSHMDTDFEEMVATILALIKCHNKGNFINFFPWAKILFFLSYRSTHKICHRMLCLTQQKEEEHLATYDKNQCRDVLDALIRLSIRSSCTLDQDQVLHTVQEYIGAGLDIVYVAVTWAVLYLARFQEVQRLIRAEVDKVIGPTRSPAEADMKDMPYTNAFILELLRHTSLVPFALPHSTLKDTYLNNYFIPNDTFVLINLYSVSRDASLWPEPEQFRPERFLSPESVAAKEAKEGFYPFGLGRRRCLGDKVSRMEMFLYVTSLLQASTVERPAHVREYSLQPQFGIILRPQPYEVLFKPR